MFEEEIIFADEPAEYPEGERETSCCFSGHRVMSKQERERLLYRLRSTVLWLVSKGVVRFHAGGALGFDTIAATTVIDIKRKEPDVKLILDLPYKSQTRNWSDGDKRIYDFILENADKVSFCGKDPNSREEASGLLHKRNRILVDSCAYCVCYMKNSKGGTAYTVDYAKKKDLEIINLAGE